LSGHADPLTRWNAMSAEEAESGMLACCGSKRWARKMAEARPFSGEDELFANADRIFRDLSAEDWLEAFAAHPKIGERASGEAATEQAGARGASPETLAALARANREYEERFGYIFIVCASGRSAEEMLDLCRRRLHNAAAEELKVAAEEQRMITRLRLLKMMVDY
jgi:allantoicase